MKFSDLSFTQQQLTEAIRLAEIDKIVPANCERFAVLLSANAAKNASLEHAHRFLYLVCVMRLRPEAADLPFSLPGTEWDCNAITDDQIAIVSNLALDQPLPELRARLCDLVWVRLRRPEIAKQAALDYLESAEQLAKDGHYGSTDRLKRALQLAALLGRNQQFHMEVKNRFYAMVTSETYPAFLAIQALEMAIDDRSLDPVLFYVFACDLGRKLIDDPNRLGEERCWRIAVQYARKARDIDAETTANIELARCYERAAAAANMKIVAVDFLKKALRTYRDTKGTEADRQRVKLAILDCQVELPGEFGSIVVASDDLSPNCAAAISRIRGRDKRGAICELILAPPLHSASTARKNAEGSIRQFPLQNMFASEKYGGTWKTASTTPAALPGEVDIPESRIRASMIREYELFFGIVAFGTITPMLEEIRMAHNVTMVDIEEFVYSSSLIPPGRQPFFCIGMYHGIHGRFIEALHVLIPQLEHLIRYFHSHNGMVTSSFAHNDIQREFDLAALLQMPETETLLGTDLHTTCQFIFTDHTGLNLRNQMAHAMLGPDVFYSATAMYAWWLIIYCTVAEVAVAFQKNNSESPS